VFQVASIILWSLDDYYYYAFCIALISTLSVVTTLIDTKKVRKHMPGHATKDPHALPDYQAHAGDVSLLL
jgi:hypothetical protein